MRSFTLVLAGLTLILLVATGCDGENPVPTTAPSPSPKGTTEWLTLIPEDVTLSGRPQRYSTRLYDYVCLDPVPRLRTTAPTDQRASVRSDGSGGQIIERLAVYVDRAAAAEALRDLRGEIRQCGETRDHVGAELHWYREQIAVLSRVAEAWHFYSVTEPAGPGAFVSLVRVGNAVYITDHRGPTSLTEVRAKGVESRGGIRRLRAFLPTLFRFAGTTGAPPDPLVGSR